VIEKLRVVVFADLREILVVAGDLADRANRSPQPHFDDIVAALERLSTHVNFGTHRGKNAAQGPSLTGASAAPIGEVLLPRRRAV
jgi:hypothetical protein